MKKQIRRHNPRIIGGNYKGRKLKVPQGARPMTDRVKMTIFDILGEHVAGKKVLDLFAGTGNLGIEALSRGANTATFVDASKEALAVIKENLNTVRPQEPTKVVLSSFLKFINNTSETYDLIFLDPPFEMIDKIRIDQVAKVLAEGGIIVYKVESTAKRLKTDLFSLLDARKIGVNTVYFLSKS